MIAKIANWAFAALLLAIGLYLAIRGVHLISLGGSLYYALAGIALCGVSALLALRSGLAGTAYALIVAATIFWSIPEAGLDLIALLPRLAAWLVVGLWFLTPWHRAAMIEPGRRAIPASVGTVALLLFVLSSTQSNEVIPFERQTSPAESDASDWRHYGSSEKGTRFSSLAQITRKNAHNLEEVWRYKTNIPYEYKNTPIQVNDKVYTCTPGNIVIAVNAKTGKEEWRFNPQNKLTGSTWEELAKGNTFTRGCRGVAYHESTAEAAASCPRRILTGTTDARLFAINADTGERCEDFGDNGEVDLRIGLGPHPAFAYFHTSVPLVAGDTIAIGGWVVDNQELQNPSGSLRAFNAIDGSFSWAWDVGRPGDPSLPPEGETFTLGTPNVWSMMSYDPERDLIFAPTGNASPDYYGGKRRDIDDAINASVIALKGETGEFVWSYKTVNHDIWDYDVPSQPTLIDITKDGERIPALAQPTKRGEIFLLDRRDGTPIWPATTCPDGSNATEDGQCPVPQDPAEGDWTAATQPFSGLPHFRTPRLEKDMWGLTPLDQLYCRIEFKKMRYEGHFTPPMPGGGELGESKTYGGTFQYPGNAGGFNWPSVSVDADNGLLIAQPMLMGNRIYMMTAAERAAANPNRPAAPASNHEKTGQGPWDADAPRYGITKRFVSKWKIPFTNIASDMPCFEPPYGRLAVIDLNSNKLLWSRPIGNMTDLGPFGIKPGLHFEVGTPVYGGTTTTRGGIIFQAGTLDSTIRAIDISNGKTLWSQEMRQSVNGTPITYMQDGRQFVVVPVPDDPEKGEPTIGGELVAFALPE